MDPTDVTRGLGKPKVADDKSLRELLGDRLYYRPFEDDERMAVVASDHVNSPSHYNAVAGRETIDTIREMLTEAEFIAFCRGQVLKYTARAPYKGNFKQDMRKASWYATAAGGIDPRTNETWEEISRS